MPSLQHAVVARVLPRLRPPRPLEDREALHRDLVDAQRRAQEGPPARLRRGRTGHIANDRGFPVFGLGPRGGAASGPRRTLLHLHGGAYTSAADPRHWLFAARLGDALGADVVLPAYPLAPEHTVEDSFDAVVDLVAETAAASPGGLVLSGDSAGGGYALAVAQALRDRGLPGPRRMVLLAPWVDLTTSAPGTTAAAARDPWLSLPHLEVYARMWAGSVPLSDPRVSPGLGDLAGLPPTWMCCGTRDLLQPGCDALFDRGEAAGWDLTYAVARGLLHVYPLLPVPEARLALRQLVGFCGPAPAA